MAKKWMTRDAPLGHLFSVRDVGSSRPSLRFTFESMLSVWLTGALFERNALLGVAYDASFGHLLSR